MGIIIIFSFAYSASNNDAESVAEFINRSTPSDALFETYDSELLFLVQRRFHFPPDQVQVELNKRTFLDQDIDIQYDPAGANPDYIVVGPYSKLWELYNTELANQGKWRLIYQLPQYSIYKSVR
jgi:hypothetical protein